MAAKVSTNKIADLDKSLVLAPKDSAVLVARVGYGWRVVEPVTESKVATEPFLDSWVMAGSKNARKAAVIRFFQGLEYGSGKLVKKTVDALEQPVFDGGFTFRTEQFVLFSPETSLKGGLDLKVGLRLEGIDLSLVGNRLMFWPPPIRSATVTSQASWAWVVDGDDASDTGEVEEAAVKALEAEIGSKVLLFRMYTRGSKATRRWVARPKGQCSIAAPADVKWEGKDEDDEERTFVAVRRCALCSISSLFLEEHDHVDCPSLATINKVREGQGYLKATNVEGVLGFPREKAPIDAGKRFKDIDAKIADLEKRLKAIEDASKTGTKKRKAEDVKVEGGSAKKAKKEGGGKKGADKEGGAKGKGKASGPGAGKAKPKAKSD